MEVPVGPATCYGASLNNRLSYSAYWQDTQPAQLFSSVFERDFLNEGFLSSCLDYYENIQIPTPLPSQCSPPQRTEQGAGCDASTNFRSDQRVLPAPAEWVALPAIPNFESPLHHEELNSGLPPSLRPLMIFEDVGDVDSRTRLTSETPDPRDVSQPPPAPPPPKRSPKPKTRPGSRTTRRRTSVPGVKAVRRVACHCCKAKKIRCDRNPNAWSSQGQLEDDGPCLPCLRFGLLCDYSAPPVGSLAHTVGVRRHQQRKDEQARRPAKTPPSSNSRPKARARVMRPRFTTPVLPEDFAEYYEEDHASTRSISVSRSTTPTICPTP
ncbi:hypothetical protein BKA70DRAFT_1246395 [Coprinopsis sp. MPI-PUGE-AT-0042]|nr:hypothetical protein BKA70DRAFT_1246395 [Coprinopsis sp. MPI-PUGE-AT-0042]